MAEKFCCKALTAECVSCSLGQTKEKFCSEHKNYLGCESGTGNNKETGSKVNVESTIDNNDKKNDDNDNESKNNNDKKKKNSNDNSGKQYTTINNNNNNNNTEINNNKDDAKISKSTNGEIFPPAKKSLILLRLFVPSPNAIAIVILKVTQHFLQDQAICVLVN